MEAFAKVAEDSAIDPMLNVGERVSQEYQSMRGAVKAALGIAQLDNTQMIPFDDETFRRLLKELPPNKSPDCCGVQAETIMYSHDMTIELIMEIEKYNHICLVGDVFRNVRHVEK